MDNSISSSPHDSSICLHPNKEFDNTGIMSYGACTIIYVDNYQVLGLIWLAKLVIVGIADWPKAAVLLGTGRLCQHPQPYTLPR